MATDVVVVSDSVLSGWEFNRIRWADNLKPISSDSIEESIKKWESMWKSGGWFTLFFRNIGWIGSLYMN